MPHIFCVSKGRESKKGEWLECQNLHLIFSAFQKEEKEIKRDRMWLECQTLHPSFIFIPGRWRWWECGHGGQGMMRVVWGWWPSDPSLHLPPCHLSPHQLLRVGGGWPSCPLPLHPPTNTCLSYHLSFSPKTRGGRLLFSCVLFSLFYLQLNSIFCSRTGWRSVY